MVLLQRILQESCRPGLRGSLIKTEAIQASSERVQVLPWLALTNLTQARDSREKGTSTEKILSSDGL